MDRRCLSVFGVLALVLLATLAAAAPATIVLAVDGMT